jgi:hypothetical protein
MNDWSVSQDKHPSGFPSGLWVVHYRQGWIAEFARKEDAELFVKFKRIEEIITA